MDDTSSPGSAGIAGRPRKAEGRDAGWREAAAAMRDRVQVAGGSLTVDVPLLNEAFGLRRMSSRARAKIQAALSEAGVEVRPPLPSLEAGAVVELALGRVGSSEELVSELGAVGLDDLRRAHGAAAQRIAELERACADITARAISHVAELEIARAAAHEQAEAAEVERARGDALRGAADESEARLAELREAARASAGDAAAAREAISLADRRVQEMQQETERLAGELEVARGLAAEGAERMAGLDAEVARLSGLLEIRDGALEQARNVAIKRRDVSDQLRAELAAASERVSQLEEERAGAVERAVALERALADSGEEARRAAAELNELRAVARRSVRAEKQVAKLVHSLQASEKEATTALEARLRAEARLKSLKQDTERLTRELESTRTAAADHSRRLDIELTDAREAETHAAELLRERDQSLRDARSREEAAGSELHELREALEATRRRAAELDAERAREAERANQFAAERERVLDAIQQALEHPHPYDGTPDDERKRNDQDLDTEVPEQSLHAQDSGENATGNGRSPTGAAPSSEEAPTKPSKAAPPDADPFRARGRSQGLARRESRSSSALERLGHMLDRALGVDESAAEADSGTERDKPKAASRQEPDPD